VRAEDERVGRLLNAQANAVALFDEVVARGIIAPGQGEQAVSDRIRDLANEMFGEDPAQAQAHRSNDSQTILEAILAADSAPCDLLFGRDGRIRTGGLLLPKQAR
jgi:hypothetical protein